MFYRIKTTQTSIVKFLTDKQLAFFECAARLRMRLNKDGRILFVEPVELEKFEGNFLTLSQRA